MSRMKIIKHLFLIYLLSILCAEAYCMEKEIILTTKTGSLYGTLLTPDNSSPKDIVALFICGSGPTDRDGNSQPLGMVNNSIKYLAEDLCNAGIPSLRYDKRAIAKSAEAMISEDILRFNTYSDDARAWIELLTKDYKQVVIIGHSEGAMLGIMASIDNPMVVSLVLLAGCGRPADVVLKEQLSGQWAILYGESGIAMDTVFSYFDTLKQGKIVSDPPQELYSLFRPSVQPYMISWFAVDPVVEIKKIKVPILIVEGDKDIQVFIKDAELLHQANRNSTKIIIPNMNHVFKECNTMDKAVQMPLYSNPALKNVPQLSECVIEFINKNQF